MSKIKNGGLDQYGAGPFEQQQFGTAGAEGVKSHYLAIGRPTNSLAPYVYNTLIVGFCGQLNWCDRRFNVRQSACQGRVLQY